MSESDNMGIIDSMGTDGISPNHMSACIKAEAKSLGFCACGIAKAEAVDSIHRHNMEMWISRGYPATMN